MLRSSVEGKRKNQKKINKEQVCGLELSLEISSGCWLGKEGGSMRRGDMGFIKWLDRNLICPTHQDGVCGRDDVGEGNSKRDGHIKQI